MNTFTKEQIHSMLDDISDVNSSITVGSVIKRIRDDIDAEPPTIPAAPTARDLDTTEDALYLLAESVARCDAVDCGDAYEVPWKQWVVLEGVLSSMPQRIMDRVGEQLRKEVLEHGDDEDDDNNPYDENGDLIRTDYAGNEVDDE